MCDSKKDETMKNKTARLLVSSLILLTLLVTSCTQADTEEEELNLEEATQELDTEEKVATEVEATTPDEIWRSGWIYEDEIWSGTVHITGDVTVDPEVTLTILPGTLVLFAAHQDDRHGGLAVPRGEGEPGSNDPAFTLEYARSHSKMDVFGRLIAKGTPENMIIFTSDSQTPDGGDWVQVHIGYGSIIEYCILEYARGALDVMQGTGDSVLISNNIIRHNLWTALAIHSSSPTVIHNEIYHSGGHQGIDVIGEGSALYIAYNVIKECRGGINILPGTAPIVEYNTLIDNDHGIGMTGPDIFAIIKNNVVSSPNGPSHNFTYNGEPVYFSSILLGRDDAISGISVSDCSPTITHNSISQCNSAGINIMGNSSPIINNNTTTNNHTGILLDESFTGSPRIEANNICDNSYANITLWSAQSVSVINNWWGTVLKTEIEDRIIDTRHNPSFGMVVYEPFLTEPVEID